jgi:hypothetical protein
VVWGGGKTEDDAKLALFDWEERNARWGTLFVLAPGYPKIVRSDEYAEFNKGFFIVLLGLCPSKSSTNPNEKPVTAAETIDALEPNTYEKSVTTSEPPGCPSFQAPEPEVIDYSVAEPPRVDKNLRVVVLTGIAEQQGDFASSKEGILVIASRRGRAGALIEESVVRLGGEYESQARLRSTEVSSGSVKISWVGASPTCAMLNPEAEVFETVTTISPRLKVSTRESKHQRVHCNWEQESSLYEHPLVGK